MMKLVKFTLLIFLLSQAECLSQGKHLRNKRQALSSSVCNLNACLFGQCEIVSQVSAQCHCNAGYSGSSCNVITSTNTNPCAANPCFNSGSCANTFVNGFYTFQCTCPAGWYGPQCRGLLTCSCFNGGACVYQNFNGVNNYRCSCPANFGGNQCQYSKVAFQSCQNVGCQNGGYCSIFSTCICPTNYSGTFCDIFGTITSVPVTVTAAPVTNTFPLNVCNAGICQNGGTCYQITYSLALCSCPTGFTGIYCNIATGAVVTSVPVTVAPVTNVPVTVTVAPVTVTVAPVTVTVNPIANSFCGVNPCRNGGQCISGAGTSGRCLCPAVFTGVLCETGYTCQGFICPNGQLCNIVNNIPTCQ